MSPAAGDPAAPQPGGQHDDDVLGTAEAGPAAVRGGLLRIIGYGAGLIFGVGSAAVLLRYLGVVDTGRYITVLALVTIVGGVTDAGMTAVGVRELSAVPGETRAGLMGTLLGLRLVATTAGIALAVGFAAAVGFTPAMVAGTALAGLGTLLANMQQTYAAALMARLKIGWVAGAELIRGAATAVAIVALVLADASLLAFLATPIAGGLASLLVTVWLVRGEAQLLPTFNRVQWAAIVRQVLPFAAGTAIYFVYFRVAVVILTLVGSEKEAGYFGAAFRVVDVLLVIPLLMVGTALPIFARAATTDKDRLAYGLDRVFQACLILGVLMALLLGIGAPVAIEVVAGSEFGPAADALRIQGIALGAAFFTAAWSNVMLSLGMYRQVLWVSAGGLIVGSIAAAVLGATAGATGAASATAAAEVGLALAAGLVLVRAHPELRPSLASAPKVLLAAAVAVAAGVLPGLPALPATAIAGVVFIGLIVALRVLPPELLEAVRRRRPGTEPA